MCFRIYWLVIENRLRFIICILEVKAVKISAIFWIYCMHCVSPEFFWEQPILTSGVLHNIKIKICGLTECYINIGSRRTAEWKKNLVVDWWLDATALLKYCLNEFSACFMNWLLRWLQTSNVSRKEARLNFCGIVFWRQLLIMRYLIVLCTLDSRISYPSVKLLHVRVAFENELVKNKQI